MNGWEVGQPNSTCEAFEQELRQQFAERVEERGLAKGNSEDDDCDLYSEIGWKH